MIALERHIETLLLSNDCVIVPGLGGFMSHHVSAHFDESDSSFIPPIRTLGFNRQLTINDSLLAQSYIEVYDLSYPEAVRRIESDVNEIIQRLENKGEFEFHGIGTLKYNEEHNLEFTPCTAGILTPEFYGFGNFVFKPLIDFENTEETTAANTLEVTEQTEKEEKPAAKIIELKQEDAEEPRKSVCIPMNAIRYSLAAAMLIFAFFIMPSQPGSDRPMQSSVCPNSFRINHLPDAEPVTGNSKETTKNTEAKAEEAKKEDIKNNVPETTVEAVQEQKIAESPVEKTVSEPAQPKSFTTIVLASKVSKRNAEDFVKRLTKAGYNQAEIYSTPNITRVIYGHYASETEAVNALRQLRTTCADAAEAWTMEIKN